MTERSLVDRRSLLRVRWGARLPQIAVFTCLLVLAVAGLRAAVGGSDSAPATRVVPAGADLAAEGLATAFARAYLTWEAGRPDEHERRLAGFATDAVDERFGVTLPQRGEERVIWAAAVQDVSQGQRRRTVTVAAETTRGMLYLAVPVARDARGFLSVGGYPAVVGQPALTRRAPSADEPEVEDPELLAVAERAVRNYLAREPRNLSADLDSRAVITLPPVSLEVQAVERVTRAGVGRVAVIVVAAARAGGSLTLRYELAVVRRDRWYVRSIVIDPTRGGSR